MTNPIDEYAARADFYILHRRKLKLGQVLYQLADDLILKIFSYLTFRDVVHRVSTLARGYHDLASRNTLWEMIWRRRFYSMKPTQLKNIKLEYALSMQLYEVVKDQVLRIPMEAEPISVYSGVDHVCQVLAEEMRAPPGLVELFRIEMIDGEDFLGLNDGDLKALGIQFGWRKKVIDYIQTIGRIPDIKDYSRLEEAVMIDEEKMDNLKMQEEISLDHIMDSLNDISSMLETRDCLWMMPPMLHVKRSDIELCRKLFYADELNCDIELSDRNSIDYFTDIEIECFGIQFGFGVIKRLEERTQIICRSPTPLHFHRDEQKSIISSNESDEEGNETRNLLAKRRILHDLESDSFENISRRTQKQIIQELRCPEDMQLFENAIKRQIVEETRINDEQFRPPLPIHNKSKQRELPIIQQNHLSAKSPKHFLKKVKRNSIPNSPKKEKRSTIKTKKSTLRRKSQHLPKPIVQKSSIRRKSQPILDNDTQPIIKSTPPIANPIQMVRRRRLLGFQPNKRKPLNPIDRHQRLIDSILES